MHILTTPPQTAGWESGGCHGRHQELNRQRPGHCNGAAGKVRPACSRLTCYQAASCAAFACRPSCRDGDGRAAAGESGTAAGAGGAAAAAAGGAAISSPRLNGASHNLQIHHPTERPRWVHLCDRWLSFWLHAACYLACTELRQNERAAAVPSCSLAPSAKPKVAHACISTAASRAMYAPCTTQALSSVGADVPC